MKRKALGVGVILLLIGVAVAPSIDFHLAKASPNNDLIEVTTQTCGIQGYENTTVKLTTQQYHDLEQYLVEFRARLNQTTTKEETMLLFKDAVAELNKYSLLPKGMSQHEAECLILGACEHPRVLHALDRVQTFSENTSLDDLENNFCLVAGQTMKTQSMGLLPLAVLIGSFESLNLASWFIFLHVGYHLGQIYMTLGKLFLLLGLGTLAVGAAMACFFGVLPISGLGMISLGGFESNGYWAYPVPASGWINTLGAEGKQNWTGEFYGNITVPDLIQIFLPFPGIIGFTGFKISRLFHSDFYIGFALKAQLARNHA
jgi:hypothetical protein